MRSESDGKLVLVDFEWAVKRGKKGDYQTYPDNPLSKCLDIHLTWDFLKAVQDFVYYMYTSSLNKHAIPVFPFDKKSLSNFQNIVDKCAQKWERKDFISRGSYGSVYIACKIARKVTDDCDYIMKIQKADMSFYTEVKCISELQNLKFIPHIYAAWTCDGNGFIIMEKLEKCNPQSEPKIYEKLKAYLSEMLEYGWLYVDIHKENFMCRNNGKDIVLIDFGWAAKKGPLGDNQTYPYHPLSVNYGYPVKWDFIKNTQEHNLVEHFGHHLNRIERNKLLNLYTNYKHDINSGKIQKTYPKVEVPKILKNNYIYDNCDQKNWVKEEFISKGINGSVFVACRDNNCKYVMKIQEAGFSFNNEVQSLIELQNTGLSPKIYAAWTCKNQGFIVMERLYKCFNINRTTIYNQVSNILEKFNKLGWLIVDLHYGNFMCRENGELVLIDFGWAVKRGPMGNYELYTKHPVLKIYGRYRISWAELELIQSYLLQTGFNPNEKDERYKSVVEKYSKEIRKPKFVGQL